jgi:N-acetylglucosamine-6-phosphate deacetylase
LRLALRAKGIDRIALVTDMMGAAGMPPSRYTLGGQPVVVDATSARLIDGTLAGSILTLDQAVRNIVRWAGVGVVDALRMVTEIPARLLAMPDRGRIARGAVADFALFDTALRVVAAIVGGQQVYGGAPPGVGTGQQPNWN